MFISVVKSCTLTQSIYHLCLGQSDFQMYHFYNCFLGLKAWQGVGNVFLVAYCFLFVGFTVSDWVSTFCLTLYCVIQYARSKATLEPRKKKNDEMQLNSFADIFLSHFIHGVWTPGVLQPFEIQRQMLRAHHHENWHQWKSLSKLLWHWTTECFQHKWKADTIHRQLMGQPQGKMSDSLNFFLCNYYMISTLKSIRNTIFLRSVFCDIVFFTISFLLSYLP